ncbi:MAG: bifunctional 4-hydroxy-3-methylbut-2-enyl diphosphate reductase/30S ribosomal protein S1 [Firmicutes bacterium]|nr:bifunctional 4-hydroxy-3-methylbut-2-enyl diphosphate reductase/30S ribosomal protein S1 [Bacillota bacterium]
MKITLAESAGYCPGVDKAVQLAIKTASESGREVYSLGPIIHNPQVVEDLQSRGVQVVEDLADLPAGSTILVRSHGLPPQELERANKLGLHVVDATCVFVRRAQNYAKELYQAGYKVVIIGDPGHPEVVAIAAHTDNTAMVIRNPNELDDSCFRLSDKVGVIAQTTQRWENLQACITTLIPLVGELRFYSTICPASTKRQAEVADLAKNNEVVLVIGGKNSANTTNLANIARNSGAQTYHIEDAGEIDPEWFRGVTTVGITAGASTPRWIIEGVIARMDEIKDLQTANISAGEVSAEATNEGEQDAYQVMSDALQDAGPKLEKGATVKAKVVRVEPDKVWVNVGDKSEGIIPLNELGGFKPENAGQLVSDGDEFDAVVIKVEDEDGHPILSKRRADRERDWQRVLAAKEEDGTITATVKAEVKGGLLVDLGIRGFVPASQVSVRYVENLSDFIGQELEFKVVEIDEARKNVVLSHKEVEEEAQERAKQEVFNSLQEGQVITGRVKRLTDFGAFVEIKPGVEGLLHVSEIAWERVQHPADVLREGEEIEVKVLGVDREKGRISLGRKQVLPDPWTTLAKNVKIGSVIPGEVTRVVDFGAFVRIAEGVEGLVHISELAHHHVASAEEVVKPGDQVEVKVLSIDPDARRVSLSIKQAKPEPKKEPALAKAKVESAGTAAISAEPETEGYTIADRLGDIFDSLKKDE